MVRPSTSGTRASRWYLEGIKEQPAMEEEPTGHGDRMRRRSRVHAWDRAAQEERAARIPGAEEARRRRFRSVVMEASPYTGAAVMVGRTTQLPSAVAAWTQRRWRWSRRRWCGPSGGGCGRGGTGVDSAASRSVRQNLAACWCHVQILRLVFMERAARAFIDGPQ
jgi:hypothetical protein